MKQYTVNTGTVTYAIKGRDVLRRAGFNAYIERKSGGTGAPGCGYAIITRGDIVKAEHLLREAGVKIIEISDA